MKANEKSHIANSGETLASQYMITKGYHIANRNYHSAYGEIDIIAILNDEIAFIEVKTRSCHSVKAAQDSITLSKRKKITLTAMHFLAQNPQYKNFSCRFDLVVVFHYAKDDTYKVLHYPDAFKPVYNQE